MSLENVYFKKTYYYNVDLAHKAVCIIRFSKKDRRQRAYKNLLFKMMRDIVKKNICNYLNLLQKIDGKSLDDIPSRDELISDCFVILDKCINKFKIVKGERYDFYFYYNKSLSRSFFRDYKKELQKSNKVELTEAVETVVDSLHDNSRPDTTELLMHNLGLDEIEKRICRSRLLGQKTSEFLDNNLDITANQYSRSLKKIKVLLTEFKNNGEL